MVIGVCLVMGFWGMFCNILMFFILWGSIFIEGNDLIVCNVGEFRMVRWLFVYFDDNLIKIFLNLVVLWFLFF